MFTPSTSDEIQMLHCHHKTHPNPNSDPEIAPDCPRCASPNTKFCYYNNYSLSQPRYFCKNCRRYWTKGGSLRNVPVGGGCRKSRRSRASRAANRAGGVSSFSHRSPDATPTEGDDPKGSDIDLAAVFANYLNPQSEPSSSAEESASLEELLMEGEEFNELGLESLLNDQAVQDALWSSSSSDGGAAAAALPYLSPADNIIVDDEQRFRYFPAGDDDFSYNIQEKISSSGNSDIDAIWSSFDVSGLM